MFAAILASLVMNLLTFLQLVSGKGLSQLGPYPELILNGMATLAPRFDRHGFLLINCNETAQFLSSQAVLYVGLILVFLITLTGCQGLTDWFLRLPRMSFR